MSPLRFLSRTSAQILLVIVVALALVRLALPHFVKDYVNKTLDDIPGYTGAIEDVTISLYRGAYTIHGTRILKTGGAAPVPFFSASETDLSIEWGALFKGKLVGEIALNRPALNFVHSESPAGRQTSIGSEWLEAVKNLFPLRINRFDITDGEIHYRDFESDPKVDVTLDAVQVEAKNFSNTRTSSVEESATLHATAKFENSAPVTVDSEIWPGQKVPTFNVQLKAEDVPVVRLNDYLRAYGNFDAEKGDFSLYGEIEVGKGKIKGYAKPLLRDVSIVRWRSDNENPLAFIWENVVSLVAQIFTNQRRDQFATTIPIEGNLDSPEIGYWQSFVGILRNAFVSALKPGLDSGEKESP